MSTFRTGVRLTVVLWVYAGTVYGCPFRKLVDAHNKRKIEHASQTETKDIIGDPIPPKWSEDPEKRKNEVRKWELWVLSEAEKQWKTLGVKYKRIPYKDGEALEVLAEGEAPLNLIFKTASTIAKKTKYPFSILFSPRSLVREWPEEHLHFLVGGSFTGTTNTIHLPFSSVEEAALNSTFHHEFLHAIFDYYREHGINSAYHGQFFSRDGKSPMWRGTHYTDFLSLEELATFPVNLRIYEMRIDEILREPDAVKKAKIAKRFVRWVSSHSLTNAVNALHASQTIGHIIRHLREDLKDIELKGQIRRKSETKPWAVNVAFSFANITYTIEITEEKLTSLIPELASSQEVDLAKVSPALRSKISNIVREQLDLQHKMAKGAASSADKLMRELINYSNKEISDSDLNELSELLLATRKATLPFIKPQSE